MSARDRLADYAHTAWAGWMQYLFSVATRNPDGTVTLPAWAVARWERQMATAYADLPPGGATERLSRGRYDVTHP